MRLRPREVADGNVDALCVSVSIGLLVDHFPDEMRAVCAATTRQYVTPARTPHRLLMLI